MKVLIISAYDITNDNATSITINRIFEPIKNENKAYIICTTTKKYSNDQNILYLDNTNIYLYLIKQKIKLFLKSKDPISINNSNIKHTHYRNNIFSLFDILNYKKSKELNNFISLYKPDLIYSPLGSLRIMELCLYVSNKYKIPIVPHFMDDWPSTLYTYQLSSIFQKLKLEYLLYNIFKKNKKVFTISDYMSQEYEKRYHVSCTSLMNAISINKDQKTEYDFHSIGNVLNLCYYGGLHLNRWKSLLLLCNTIHSLLNEFNININIYSKKEEWDKISNNFTSFHFIKFVGYFNSEIAYSLLKKEDILIHLESFDEEVAMYTKLSISTKIPEYLSLKKPIIAIGPYNIASINYLKTNNCAIVIDYPEEACMVEKIALIRDHNYLEMISNNAYNLYISSHTVETNNTKLIDFFKNITNN